MALLRSDGTTFGSVGSINTEYIGRPIPARSQLTPFGRMRRYHDIPAQEKCFLYLSLISGAVSIILTVERLIVLKNYTPDWVLAWVVLINAAFSLRYVTVAVFFQQWLEMFNFCTSRSISVVHVVIYFFLAPEGHSYAVVAVVKFCLVVSFGAMLIPWGLYLSVGYKRSNDLVFLTANWNTFDQNGAVRLYVIQAMLILNMQVELSVILLAVEKGFREISTFDIVTLTCGPIFILMTRIIAHKALKFEKRSLVYFYVILSLFEIALIGFEFRAIAYPDITSIMRIAVIVTGSFGMALQMLINFLILKYERVYFGTGLNTSVFNVHTDPPRQRINADDDEEERRGYYNTFVA